MDASELELLEGRREHILVGVREYTEGYPVELLRDLHTGRMMLTAWNEGHNNYTKVDLLDLIAWLQFAVSSGLLEDVFRLPEGIKESTL